MLLTQLLWYLHRLRTMSGPEMLWRAGRLRERLRPRRVSWADAGAELFGGAEPSWPEALLAFRAGTDRPVLLDRDRAAAIAAADPDAVAAVVAAAERVLTGQVRYFGYPAADLGVAVDWNHDPLTGTRWPTANSERIDHRTAAGDPKWIWELNRLQHLPWLAQAWLFTGETRFADAAFEHLDSWVEQQRPGAGIAWRGAFECGVRAISVAVAVQGLRDAPGLTPERYRRYVVLLGESARRCWSERSLFSSANNHLIGELAGLAVVAVLLPEIPAARRWSDDALALLTEHADRQLLPDGAGAEQALAYQIFTVELIGVVHALLALRGEPPARLAAAIARSSRYLALTVGDTDPDPRYGDDDGGFALRLGPEEIRTVRAHLGIADALVPEPAAARAGTPSMTATWLRAALGSAASLDAEPMGSGYAPDGGLVVLRARNRRASVDVGPLGYLSIAAHGHADALALTLAAAGHELIGDPGTASYYGHPGRRAAHRSTRAHATVTVDDLDQSVMGGPFLWRAHAAVRVRAVDLARGVVDAEHDGYTRLADPVVHRRWVIAAPDHPDIVVVDAISGTGTHSARLTWPLHPSLDVRAHGPGHLATRAGTPVLALAYAANHRLETTMVRGDESTDLGWWSERLESREPSWSVGAYCTGGTPLALLSVLTPLCPDAESPHTLKIAHAGDRITAHWITGDARRTVTIDPNRPGAAEIAVATR
ncbi:alginate lyase family protein [Nocardia sp. NPDC005978]|uniref:heparinase II/III family protein n=1 Tax=Nocardia sp. NPDC005978 TaxID=3156725 RepID=UPI0033BA1C17